MDHKLVDLLDSLSGQASCQPCPVCHRHCACASTGHIPPRNDGGSGQSGV
jgi:hypothetical protein